MSRTLSSAEKILAHNSSEFNRTIRVVENEEEAFTFLSFHAFGKVWAHGTHSRVGRPQAQQDRTSQRVKVRSCVPDTSAANFPAGERRKPGKVNAAASAIKVCNALRPTLRGVSGNLPLQTGSGGDLFGPATTAQVLCRSPKKVCGSFEGLVIGIDPAPITGRRGTYCGRNPVRGLFARIINTPLTGTGES